MAKTPTHPGAASKAEDWDAETTAAITQAPAVKIKCIVHTLPHTGIADPGAAGLGMRHKEERTVPEAVALAMVEAGQVVLV